MKPYTIGIDMGGTTIKMGLFESQGGKLKEKWEIPTRKENRGALLIPDMAGSIKKVLCELDISPAKIEGVGMGVPGAVRDDGYVAPCVNLNQWGGFNPCIPLGELLEVPVMAMNDANAAALGEYVYGGGRGYTSQVLITLGTGIGSGVVTDGHVAVGAHGAAGEVGHIKVRFDETRVCGCGKRGCLEQYASATGLVSCTRMRMAQSDLPSSLRDIPEAELSARYIFDEAKSGDALALICVDEMTKILGYALANVSAIFDPEVIVIGGGVAKAGDILIDMVKKYFVEAAFPACEDTAIVLARLGNDAGIYGALTLVHAAGVPG